jgi:uncharacterized protein (DUF1697 family)
MPRSDVITYVAFMRAINVAGHPIAKMSDVRNSFSAAGALNVRSYIQSGNVIFDSQPSRFSSVLKRIQANLRTLLGAEPQLLIRTLDELDSIVRAAPFTAFERESKIKLYVVFLSEKPTSLPKLPLTSVKEALEAIAIKDFDAFIVSRQKPNGFFGFPNNFIEKELGVSATSRNWSTVTKLVAFARDQEISKSLNED